MKNRNSAPFVESPFLTSIKVLDERIQDGVFPFTMPVFGRGDLEIDIHSPITVIVGENGAGKSTLLEAIAHQCGFPLGGGNQNHFYRSEQGESVLASALRLSWRQKRGSGFFIRAESFFNFSTYVDDLAEDDPGILHGYGGKSLHTRSHGEAFMAFFRARMRPGGIYLFDEPEAALSPTRQAEFINVLLEATADRQSQVIMATHSPMLMAVNGGEVLYLTDHSSGYRSYKTTPHFQAYADFFDNPENFVESVILSS